MFKFKLDWLIKILDFKVNSKLATSTENGIKDHLKIGAFYLSSLSYLAAV